MNFFGRMNGDFSVSPTEYHRSWRNRVGAGRSFVGPWDYASGSPGSKVRKTYTSPQNTIGGGSYKKPRGFISPVAGYQGSTRRTSFKYGDNRSHAISEE